VFFEIPLSTQIKHFFEHRNLAALIESHKREIPNDETIADITSSNGFRELKTEVNGVYGNTLVYNTDGVSPVHSSKAHLYPILATICELPAKLRASFMLVLYFLVVFTTACLGIRIAEDIHTFGYFC